MRMKPKMPLELAELLSAAAEPTRLRILNLLRLGSVCVCELQAILRIPQSTISRHLATLRHAGLVADTRDGQRVVYSLAPVSSRQLAALYELLDKCCSFEEALKEDLNALKRKTQLTKRFTTGGSS
jgi:ArsR family transcriptional regulator